MKKLAGLFISFLLVLFILAACENGVVIIEVSGIELSEGTLTPTFDSSVTSYTASVPNATDSIDVTVTVESELDLAVTINDTAVIPGTGISTIPLSVGENVITVVVTYEGETETYTITVTRAGVPEIKITGPKTFGGLDEDISSGSTINFGTILFSSPSPHDITFTIENAGTADLTLTATAPDYITITGDPDDNFDINTQPTDAVIPPGETMDFILRFKNNGVINETKTGTATIANDDDDEDTFTLALTGVWQNG